MVSTFKLDATYIERGRLTAAQVAQGENLESLLQSLLDGAWWEGRFTNEDLALTTFVIRAGTQNQVVGMFYFETDVPAASLPALIGLGPDTRLSGRWVKGDQVQWHGLYNVTTW